MAERYTRATLTDVARAAGVSVATASRALNGGIRVVTSDLRDKVIEAAAELNYTADTRAQGMVRGYSRVIGLIVSDIADPYFAAIAAGVMDKADELDLLVTLASTQRRPQRELDHLQALRGQRGRAAVVVGSRTDDTTHQAALQREIDAFEAGGGRVVMISQRKLDADTIVVENRAGARDLGRALVARGYRRFAVLGGPGGLITARDRRRGFTEALTGAGLSPVVTVDGEFTRDGGYAAAERLLAERHRVDCVFAVNDVMAVGAIAAFQDHGLALPDDLAIAGFDDINMLRDVTPRLSTVRLPLVEMGEQAVELLTDRADEHRVRRVRGEVILRASAPDRS